MIALLGHSGANILGMIGVVLVLWTYLLLQIGKLQAQSFAYSFWNLVGSLLIITSIWVHFNLASMVIEVAWALISLYGLIKSIKYLRR